MEYHKILNKYELLNNLNNHFILTIFYLEDYLCKVIIINKNNCGWDDDIKIKLYKNYNQKLVNEKDNELQEEINNDINDDINNDINEEILSLGSCDIYYKMIDFYTNIKLKYNLKNNINKNIIMVETNEINVNNYLIKYINLIENKKDHFNYIFFDSIFKRQFIKDNYSKYLYFYDLLIDIHYKNLIFILLYIYTNGGYYISDNIYLKKNILNLKNIYFINNHNVLELLIANKNNQCIIDYVDHLIINDGNFEDIHNLFKNNIKILEYSSFYINDQLIISKDKYSNIWKANKYIFMIHGKYDYEGEYLNMNYYFIKVKNNDYIEKNLILYYLNEENDILNNIIYKEENKKTFVFKIE
jgi:hypothetical protein